MLIGVPSFLGGFGRIQNIYQVHMNKHFFPKIF